MAWRITWRASGCVHSEILWLVGLTPAQEQVQSNKDLDLPTQQELLAQFRCDEIAAGALEEFNIQVKAFRKPIEGGQVVADLGKMMATWKNTALSESYDGVCVG